MSEYVILHNPHDPDSRQFVSEHSGDPDVEVIWWYPPDESDPDYGEHKDDREVFLTENPLATLQVSAFPCVVYLDPEYTEEIPGYVDDVEDPSSLPRLAKFVREAEVVAVRFEDQENRRGGSIPGSEARSLMATVKAKKVDVDALASVSWVEAVAKSEPFALPSEAPKAEPFVVAAEMADTEHSSNARERLEKIKERIA